MAADSESESDSWRRQLKVMLRKNWLLKLRHPSATAAEILLPTFVILLLVAVRMRVDTEIHPASSNIQKDMFVEVGKGISPNFQQVLELLHTEGEYLAFAPDTEETRLMINWMSIKFPLLRAVHKIYRDEEEVETYIRSDSYGACNFVENCKNPRIRGAIVFHHQGPQAYDYSIRLNHTWAFSGHPDIRTIMDTTGPFLNDLQLGVNRIPIMQYSFSGFFTLQQVLDSFIILSAQQPLRESVRGDAEDRSRSLLESSWKQFLPSKIRIVPFPTHEYTDDEFQSIVKSVMGVLYLLGFLYPISRLISYSVFEKEQKIKEGLHMMGLKDGIYHLSWFITYTLQFAISSGVITLCTMDNLFKYSDKSLVFAYFFSFGLSAIMLSFLISTFFTRTKTAVAVGTLSFFGAFFPYYTVNDPGVSMILKVLASLLSPTAFALGSINFADYERAHVGLRWSNIWRESSGVNFLVCLLMLLLDSLLYCLFGLYVNKILECEKGPLYPWDLLSKNCFKRRSKNHFPEDLSVAVSTNKGFSESAFGPAFEALSLEMKQQELDNRCIQIRNLHKVYRTVKGNCCAVNSLSLTLFENQILSLLGHNGAGKSTTISMLVGLLQPTSGDAFVFGKSIKTCMDKIRKILGVCPQNDILFPELTVREHLEIYAVLKGVHQNLINTVVNEMIDEVGLGDKMNTTVSALSGGMKRKLSLGIALIGNSKVIVLDEPTSGMDPYSMRLTWQLIKKKKKGRIILLTTHSMDEAEELGDRIAIMANGSLKCCGSSLFLKHQYGVGYTLTLVKSAPSSATASDVVYRHIPSAQCVSQVGTEISFKLPLASSPSFERMFREIEGCIISSNSERRVSDESQGIESYGISVTTLEEVFLRVAGSDLNEAEVMMQERNFCLTDHVRSQISHDVSKKVDYERTCSGSYRKAIGILSSIIQRAWSLLIVAMSSFFSFLSRHCCSCCISSQSKFRQHFKALVIKRAISARRDRKTVVFQLLLPAFFLLIGLLLLKLKPHPDQMSVTFTTSEFNPLLSGGGGGGPIPFDLSLPLAKEVAQYIQGGWIQKSQPSTYKFPDPEKAFTDAVEAAGPTLGPALLSMSEFLMSSINESYQSRYGAVVMDDQYEDGSLGYSVMHNSSCQHSAPTFINLVNAAILRLATQDKNMTIRTRNHPLPLTQSQRVQRHDLDAFSAAIIINIAFSFIPASFAVSVVKEREVKAKQQQLISGVSILSYWTSIYVWDFVSFLFPSSVALILFYIFGLEQFIGPDSLLPTVLMFMEYGLSVASSTYCLTFFFSDHTVAQNVVLLIHFLSGLILMIVSFIMGLIQSTASTNNILKNFFRISPGFCFADGLASLALLRQDMKDRSSGEALDWNVTGASICYLALESMIYFMLTLGLEFLPLHTFYVKKPEVFWRRITSLRNRQPSYLEPLLEHSSRSSIQDSDEDVDVLTERRRVHSGSIDNAIICLRDLRKVYPGEIHNGAKVAVNSLTFSVQPGECFGFLGTNGAGKTTTLSMLCGEERPTGGTAFILGKDICANPKAARQHIGYCPQFDALMEHLTVKEHLELYARIKRVPEHRIGKVVTEKLDEFDLLQYANSPSFSLSGGNKRKLSVAIAMTGDPPIVILDEPSTGMDPIAKRFMWDVISQISTRRGKTAVILTTHSMNEAQALCTRIGIMVGGRLRCIGSPQHLKTRFGNKIELEVKPTEVDGATLDNLCQRIRGRLFDFPHPRSILDDLEICIGGTDTITLEDSTVAEISLSPMMISNIGQWLGDEERTKVLLSSVHSSDGVACEQLSEQLVRDGGIPLPVFCEWWLAKEKFAVIDAFITSSFSGATFHGSNGLSVKYQLPCSEGFSLADVFGHLERNRDRLRIAEYSISQSTLESIFNHFAANYLV
ncbi:hypothetical protein MLD38_004457 [Melastoma candidum]|uniref:Uncharacterized protein n=1 Tax=Melastoma candidum TaxID=119954 RepID=A0ACB9S5S2_9MYRT|nr:hypothetical protein MLD38_004457 [Melastoma candidum]